MNIWMIGKNSMKHYYPKKYFIVTLIWNILLMQIMRPQKRICKGFEMKLLGEYHDFYVQSDAFLLANVFENFRNMHLEIHELDLVKSLLTPALVLQTAFKKTKVNLDLLLISICY